MNADLFQRIMARLGSAQTLCQNAATELEAHDLFAWANPCLEVMEHLVWLQRDLMRAQNEGATVADAVKISKGDA